MSAQAGGVALGPGAGAVVALVAAAAVAVALGALWWRERRRVRALAAERDRALRAARSADQARDTFFDLATHELRSPLSAILGYQELLRDGAFGDLDPAAREPVDRIGRSAHHLLHLIEGVVELSRLRTGHVLPDLAPVSLGLVLSAAAEAFRTQATERGLRPEVDLPGRLPTIRSDQDRLVRALDLLVTSTVKHPDDGPISFRVDPLDDGARLTLEGAAISIRDDADDPALRLGIRLAVAGRIASLLGGELRLEPPDAPVIRRLVFTVRDHPAPASPGL